MLNELFVGSPTCTLMLKVSPMTFGVDTNFRCPPCVFVCGTDIERSTLVDVMQRSTLKTRRNQRRFGTSCMLSTSVWYIVYVEYVGTPTLNFLKMMTSSNRIFSTSDWHVVYVEYVGSPTLNFLKMMTSSNRIFSTSDWHVVYVEYVGLARRVR